MRTPICTVITCVGAMTLLAPQARAQDFDVTLDTKTSNATIDVNAIIDTSGFLIGDYDAKTNPEGTQTRPGLFGGSGNQPIDTITTLSTDTLLDSAPAGMMLMSVDALGGSAEIEGLELDLLNNSPAGTTLSITIGFDTFRTVNPGFLYLGGIPITISLGEVGQLSEATLTQSAPALITLSPADLPEAFEVTGVIPALLDMTVLITLPGSPPSETPLEQIPVLLPVSGQLELVGGDHMTLSLEAQPDPIGGVFPIEGVDLPAIPFELPTLGEETAGVLFTLTPQSIELDAMLSLSINANGTANACPPDLTGDGVLNFFDISAFLNAFAAMDPVADFDGNGSFNFFDVSAFLNAYTAGCP